MSATTATTHPLTVRGHLGEAQLRRAVAGAIAHARGADARRTPDDDAAAAAVLAELRRLGALLTPATRHAVHAELLRGLAGRSPRPLDLWEPEQITVSNWLRDLGLDEEAAAAAAPHDGSATCTPRRRTR